MSNLAVTIQDVILLTGGVILPIAFAFHVFLNRRGVYATWAKLAGIIICLTALGWGALDWLLLHWKSFRLTRDGYYNVVEFRGLFAGICIALVFSIPIARPHRKTGVKTPRDKDPRPV